MEDKANLSPEDVSRHQASVLIMCGTNLLFRAAKIEPRLYDAMGSVVSNILETLRPLEEVTTEEKDVEELTGIIKEIVNNLTGDGKEDSKYLLEQIENYRDHEYAAEVLRAIGRMFYGLVPEEEKREASEIWKKEAFYIQVILNEAKVKLAEHNLDEAEKLILQILPSEELVQSDEFSGYYDFRNCLEWVYFIEQNKPSKQLNACPVSYNDVFMTYAYLLVEKQDYDNAIRIIDRGLKLNPLFVDLMHEKGIICKNQKRYDESFQISLKCFEISYTKAHIARCYRDFGYYFIENKKWDVAICCYLLSLSWDDTEMAKSELYYITQQTGQIVDEGYYVNNLDNILQHNGVPRYPNQLWLEVALNLGKATKDIEEAKFCYSAAYELTNDESIRHKMLELDSKLG